MPTARYFRAVGTLLFVGIFIDSGVRKGVSFGGTVEMMRSKGVPLPTVMAFGCVVVQLLGAALLVTMQPLLRVLGAKLLIIFTAVATYLGHYKVMRALPQDVRVMRAVPVEVSQGRAFHFWHNLKNLSIIGGCIMIIGYDGPLVCSGSDWPVHGHLAAIFHFYEPYFIYFEAVGTFLLVCTFLVSGVSCSANFGETVETVTGFGLPCPTVMAIAGTFCQLAGSVLLLTMKPVFREWGAEFLIMFTIVAMYFGHYKAMKAAPEGPGRKGHLIDCWKDLSIIGIAVMTIGYAIPRIGA